MSKSKHYLLFDENGKFTSSLLEGIHFKTAAEKKKLIAQGYVNIDDDTYNTLIGNNGMGDNGTGYLYVDGKVVSAPPAEVDPDAEKKAKLAELDTQYEADKAVLLRAYLTALASGDADAQADAQADIQALNADYDEQYKEIAGEE